MRGRFLIGPHAVERIRERVPARRGASLEQMLDDSARWRRVRQKSPGVGLYRHSPEPRYRIVVDERDPMCLKVITVLGVHDRC